MSHFKTLSIIILIMISSVFSGCNGSTPSSSSSASKSSSNSVTLPTGSEVNALAITAAVRSNQDPNNLLELLSAGGEIGNVCPAAADCACRFKWTESNGTFREVDQDLAYVESNMARCLTTQITTGTTFFDVALLIKAGNQTSNTIRFGAGSLNPSLDPSLSSNYVPIQRYQCRDSVAKSADVSGGNTNYYQGLVDPRLWKMGYAFNFFTSSLGSDYGATLPTGTSVNVSGWECPPIPNDTNFDPMFDLKLYSVDPIDLSNPSLTGVVTGDNTIYPSSDNLNYTSCVNGTEAACEQYKINRHDFYMASFQDGIFKIPVCMIHSVSARVSSSLKCVVDKTKGSPVLGSAALKGTGDDIVGFGAVPDANQACPASNQVAIPSGKKWAKLWQMRASMPVRTIQDSSDVEIGDLFCTNRKKECVNVEPRNSAFTSWRTVCHSPDGNADTIDEILTGAMGPFIGPWISSAGQTKYGNCNSTGMSGDNQPPTGGGAPPYPTTTACNAAGFYNCCRDHNKFFATGDTATQNARLPANYTPSGDYCNPSLMGSINGVSFGGEDNWLMGNGGRWACIESDTDSNGALINSSFPDPLNTYALAPKQLETNSSFDIVFVVTPPSVTIENMQDPNDAVGKQYRPRRFLPNGGQVVYNFESGSTTLPNGQPVASQYPLCVLQEKK